MMNGLNFNRSLFTVFLAFVSFLITITAQSPASAEEKDEFSLFESQKPTSSSSPAPTGGDIDRLKAEVRNDPENISLIVELAETFIEKGDNEKATLLLWKHVDKLDRDALLVLARAHEKRNEPSEMIRALNIVVAKNEKDVEALTLMGKAYVLQKKNKEAMESFKKAVEINKKYEPAYMALVDYYEKRNPPNLYELRILFQDMIDSIGPRYQYLLKLCEINTMDSTYEPAIKSCNAAITKNSKNADPYVYLGLSYRAIGEDDKGLKVLKKAANDFPDSELAQYTYAKTLEENKNFVDAMNFYKVATEANEKSARSWLGLATTSFEIRKYEVAMIAFKKACQFDKKNAAAFRKAAATLRNAKNIEWSEKFVSSAEHCTF